MTNTIAHSDVDTQRTKTDLVDSHAIADAIWRQRRVLFIVWIACVVLAIFYLHVAKYRYEVTMQVTPVSQNMQGNLKSLGALASAAGINLPDATSTVVDPFELYLQGIYTRDTATEVAMDQALMRQMFPKEWDAETKTWRDPHPNLDAIIGLFKAILGFPVTPWHAPDGARLETYIENNVTISRDLRNPVVTIQLLHAHPNVAIDFLVRLQQADDGHLRRRVLARSLKYIEYLDHELTRVTVEDYRQALLELLADQEKKRMFASSPSVSYAAEMFQEPTASPKPSAPIPVLVIFLSIFVGFLFGGLVAFVWDGQLQRIGAALKAAQ